MVQIPIVDLSRFLADGADTAACKEVADAMEELGVLILRDPRVDPALPVRYRDMMVRFYRLPPEVKAQYIPAKLADGRHIFETGWRPPFTEKPRRRDEVLHLIPEAVKPCEPPPGDPKERFMWPIGPRRAESKYPELDFLPRMRPVEIRDWVDVCAEWETAMYSAMMTVMEMLAIGFDEPRELFSSLLCYGPHRLAPTGLNLAAHGAPGTVAAGFHNDLSCLTMHGRSNFPGLYAWTRSWEKFPVRLPDDGCLLVQSGRVLEHLTAGRTLRGFHEVVIGEEAQPQIQAALARGEVPWRVSTTAFFNAQTDSWVEPIGRFAHEPTAPRYFEERIECGARMLRTLTKKVVKSAA